MGSFWGSDPEQLQYDLDGDSSDFGVFYPSKRGQNRGILGVGAGLGLGWAPWNTPFLTLFEQVLSGWLRSRSLKSGFSHSEMSSK